MSRLTSLRTLILCLPVFLMFAQARASEKDWERCANLFSEIAPQSQASLGQRTSTSRIPREVAIQDYNQLLATEVSPTDALGKVSALFQSYGVINPTFAKEKFAAWLEKERPIERIFAERAGSDSGKMKLGELSERLYQEYFPFLKTVEKVPLKQRVADFSKELEPPLSALLARTRAEGKIPENEVSSFVARATKGFKDITFGGCLTKSDALFQNMLSNAVTGILMFGLHAAQKPPQKVSDFPWEYFINGLIWSVIFDRVACPKLIAREHPLGKEFVPPTEKPSFIGTVKTRLTQGVIPFLPYYVAGDGTAAMGEWLMDRNVRGVDEKKKPSEDYLYDWAFFNVWDLTYTIPKRVLILDSALFTKSFPALEEASERLLRSGMAAKVVRYGAEYATKVAQAEYVQFDVFLQAKSVYDRVLPDIKDSVHAVILLPRKFFSEDSRIEVVGEGKKPNRD